VLQSWSAIQELNSRLVRADILGSLNRCQTAVENARNIYANVNAALPQPLDPKSNDQHLEPLQEGIRLFATLAELDLS